MRVSKEVYLLYKELERLEEVLVFSVFYNFLKVFESHHFCPGFDFEENYYEIQVGDKEKLKVLEFYRFQEKGVILNKKDIKELTEKLSKL